MIQLLPPSSPSIVGLIDLPASKSISNRALVLSILSNSTMPIHHLADCDDTRVMLNTLQSTGTHFDIGAAGTSMRFLTAYLSTVVGDWTLTGSNRMKQRPIGVLVDALNQLGAKIEYAENEGYPPLRIHGRSLEGGGITLAGNISSQYISALLMVAPTMKNGLELTLEGNIISKPYIRMTLKMMETFGVSSVWNNQCISIVPQTYNPTEFTVESDWSAASYWFSIVSLCSKSRIKLLGLQKDSLQGDSKVVDLFIALGVYTEFTSDGVLLSNTGNYISKLTYDFVNQPDLAQTFVVCCCLHGIPFDFKGLHTLKIKETDRIAALINEMMKLGFVLEEPNEGSLAWNGKRCGISSEPIRTYEDHRMAMAFAPAALRQAIKIEHPEVVSKSYPKFWDDLQSVGFSVVPQ